MAFARIGYALSLPERGVRALVAGIFGATHEAAELVLPRLVRRSRLYEVTAKNALRIAIELVGRVEPAPGGEAAPADAGKVAIKKAAGNVVEFGSIAAFGFSPIWLLAGASDLLKGSRAYLIAIEDELAIRGLLAEGTHFGSVDQLLGVLEGTSGHTAGIMDLPPLELKELKQSLAELKADVTALPTPAELAQLFAGLVATARREDTSLLDVSSGVGLAFLMSARNLTRDHLVAPYAEDWQPLRSEGFAAYGSRVAKPYRDAIEGHFDPARPSLTERLPGAARAAPGQGVRLGGRALRRIRAFGARLRPSGRRSG